MRQYGGHYPASQHPKPVAKEVFKSPHENSLILGFSVVSWVAIIWCHMHSPPKSFSWHHLHGRVVAHSTSLYVYNSYLVGGFNPFEKHYSSQIGWFPQVGLKIKNIWNHHTVMVVIQNTRETLQCHWVFNSHISSWSRSATGHHNIPHVLSTWYTCATEARSQFQHRPSGFIHLCNLCTIPTSLTSSWFQAGREDMLDLIENPQG